ncbi:MAG: hypothetical protein C0475_05550 [Planctomyces sp.]|nr:hypothetical protein [Planctomyces sp.]MBA4038790.1 hypothetical protein [Planctomyces sp.]MBA4119292.1 hypothetical protein [Isosphaera sp.]
MRRRRRGVGRWLGLITAVGTLALGGCAVGGAIAALEESRRRNSTRQIDGEYGGLKGKSFAVIVTADRFVQADNPELLPRLTEQVSERLARQAEASGYVPAAEVLDFQLNTPRWVTMAYADVAEQLGVERLVVVELTDYRLHEPGNQYLWNGVAAATVGVVEVGGPLDSDFAYSKLVRVSFPDKDGYGPNDLPRAAVNTELARRLADRAAWLFYNHQEPYYPDY